MEKALGLLETKGLIGAIEAADAMAKAADIKIVCKEKITAALVTIKIVGDVAAIKSALDAGAVAAKRVGQLVSVHLIPRPDDQIDFIINNSERIAVPNSNSDIKKKIIEEVLENNSNRESDIQHSEVENQVVIDPIKETFTKKNTDDYIGSLFDFDSELTEEIEDNSFLETNINEENEEDFSNQPIDDLLTSEVESLDEQEIEEEFIESDQDENSENAVYMEIHEGELPSMDEMLLLSVPELRRIARGIKDFPIKGREISKANKQQLLEYFAKLK